MPYVADVKSRRKRALLAVAAAWIAVSAAACGVNGTHHGHRGASGTWAVVSCQVDVNYLDEVNTVDYYVPDTSANFRRHFAGSKASDGAGLAVVITFVNHTGGPAPLPTGQVVSFADQTGKGVGRPQTFNNADGTGYGAAVAHGRGSGEVFSSSTVFHPGQKVAESPDIGPSVPPEPDLTCRVNQQRHH